MKNPMLFMVCAGMCIIPWGFILGPFGVEVQGVGVLVQIVGLFLMLALRKNIWNLQ